MNNGRNNKVTVQLRKGMTREELRPLAEKLAAGFSALEVSNADADVDRSPD